MVSTPHAQATTRTSGCVTQLTAITPSPASVRWTCSGLCAEARPRLKRGSSIGISWTGGGRL